MIEYRKFITRKMIKRERDKLFVFGDNTLKKGMGGQAREMRGEKNSVGIITKKYPSMSPKSFLTGMSVVRWFGWNFHQFNRLCAHSKRGGTIVWPKDGIGTGLAELEYRAPLIWQALEKIKKELERDKKNDNDNTH